MPSALVMPSMLSAVPALWLFDARRIGIYVSCEVVDLELPGLVHRGDAHRCVPERRGLNPVSTIVKICLFYTTLPFTAELSCPLFMASLTDT